MGTRINHLIQSDSLEDKLQVVKDSKCTGDNIISILNHKSIGWTDKNNSKIIDSLLTCIVTHPSTNLHCLMSIYSYWGHTFTPKVKEFPCIKHGKDKGRRGSLNMSLNDDRLCDIRNLINKHPKWNIDDLVSILIENLENIKDLEEKFFIVRCITDADEFNLDESLLRHEKCPIEVKLDVINGNNPQLKDFLAKNLKPCGFGRLSDPNTGEVIAKIQDGNLVGIEREE